MKKQVVFACTVVLLVGMVLTGCAGKDNSRSSNVSATNEGMGQAGASDQPSSKDQAPVKFSVMLEGGTPLPSPDKDPILQQLDKDLNVDIEMNVVPSDYEQQLNVKVAGGTPPDLFQINKKQLENFGKRGVLLDIGKYLDQMPNVKKVYSNDLLSAGRTNGQLYALAKRPYIPMWTLWIRKDWLDHLGLQPPKTLDDLKKIAVAFTENDPDGNGKKDTYGMTGTGLGAFGPIFASYGVAAPGNYMIKENAIDYSTTDPAMKDALNYIHDLIAAKTVDPELMANKGNDGLQKAFQGKAGILFAGWGDLVKDEQVKQYKAINPKAEWLQVGALQGPGGKYMGPWDIGPSQFMFAMPASLEKTPDKLKKILEYLNYITGDGKGQNIVNFGIEGVHYKVENGKIVALPEMSQLGYAFEVQLTGRDELSYLSVKFAKQKPYIEFAKDQPTISVYNSLVPIPDGVIVDDKSTFETEEITKFIYGKLPLSDYGQFVKTLNDQYQLQKYIDLAKQVLQQDGYLK